MLRDKSVVKLGRGVRCATDPVTGDDVLLFPEGILVLSPCAARIVKLCERPSSVEAIVAQLRLKYRSVDAAEVVTFLDSLVVQHITVVSMPATAEGAT